jgi:hypothetical protein
MHIISQKLAAWTDARTGGPDGCSAPELEELRSEAYAYFWTTETGHALDARWERNAFLPRFVELFAERYGQGVSHPGAPMIERLIEVGNDLLIELPEPAELEPAPKANPEPAAAIKTFPVASKEVVFFGRAYSNQLLSRGVDSVRPRAGFVTLIVDGQPYKYRAAEADKLLNQAIEQGLVE